MTQLAPNLDNEPYNEQFLLDCAQELYDILILEENLYEFAKAAWPYVEGTIPFSDGWHIQAISEHLQAVTRRQIRNLIINIPPRCMKSDLVAVMWPAWVWLQNSREQFMYASYANSLSLRDSVKCRRLILSPWYQKLWGDRFLLIGDQNTKHRFDNDKLGYRIAASVGSSVTGEGGTCLVTDDANNAKDIESIVKRQSTLDWYSQVWSSRLNNPKTGVTVDVQQRTHAMDLSGYKIENDTDNEIVKLILPMEYERAHKCKTIKLPSTKGKIWKDPRTKEGELLWENHMGQKEVKRLKQELKTPYRISGQLQQRPAPAEGGIIKKAWFQWWGKAKPPHVIQVIQSWDTALEEKDQSNYSAATTWGVFKDSWGANNIILLGVWRERAGYPELRKMARRLYNDYRDDGNIDIEPDGHHIPDVVLVEAKVSGISLVQDLTASGITATKFNPNKYGDKIARVQLVTHLIEAGRVWVPALPPHFNMLRKYAELFVNSCAIFPASDARDLVDTMTQVLLRLNESRQLINPEDPEDEEEEFRGVQLYNSVD